MESYSELFERRGSAYDRAMRRFPRAREQEFAQVVVKADLRPNAVIGDVPAGGNYLRSYLPSNCVWLGHEPCATFTNHGDLASTTSTPLLPFPWQDLSIDTVISLAGVHHLSSKSEFFEEAYRVTKPGGRFVLSDALEGSAVAAFLDGYIGVHNSTGHEGAYLTPATIDELTGAGFTTPEMNIEHYHWIFDDVDDMGAFCHLLFDLCKSTPEMTKEAIINHLGLVHFESGQIGMNWSLATFVAYKD